MHITFPGRILLNKTLSDQSADRGGDSSSGGKNKTQEPCVRPAITQFPEPLMDKAARQKGGLVIHIFTAVYMFMGLAIVCDDYFVPALDKLAEGE